MVDPMEDVARTEPEQTTATGSAIAGTAEVVVPDEEQGRPANLEVDDPWEQGSTFADSTLGDDEYTVTTSVTSSIRDFRHEGGRRYHAFDEDAYFLPNDEIEAGRLDLQHYIWKLTFDGALSLVPITSDIKRVLDLGTGTGIWAIELAETNPEIEVLGPGFVPRNCQFLVDNAEYDWVFDQKFNYVHSRLLILGIHDWRRYFQQCWDNLEPGGWVETGEAIFPQKRADHEEPRDSPFLSWGNAVVQAAAKAGLDLQAPEHFTEYLEEIGFVNVERVDVKWPLRGWAKGKKNKVIGRIVYDNAVKALPAIGSILLSRHLGWTKEQLDENEVRCVEDIENNHFYSNMVCHKAQKPWTAS